MILSDEDVKRRLRDKVLSMIDMSKEVTDEDVGRIIDQCLIEETQNVYIPLKEKLDIKQELFNNFRRLDVLTEFLEEEEVSEIMVNGFQNIYVERRGSLYKTDKQFESEEKLNSVVQQIVADCNRRINDASPIVDARLRDGSRVNIVIPPVSLEGPVITIRRFPKSVIDMKRLVKLGSIPPYMIGVFDALIKSRYNIFISGGTGSGKTTFLNALSDFIPKDERIITIEDSAELQIQGVSNLVRMEARNANVEGKHSISIRELIKTSLRMRPDRIIVGEVRDEAAIDMLAAMNTGHDGSISTGHANSAKDMVSRLETMVLSGMDIPLLAVRKQISSAVDIIVHLGRLKDKSRKVLNISEVIGVRDGEVVLNTLFEYVSDEEKVNQNKGVLRKVNDLININKLTSYGMLNVYEEACGG
ncbi:MAG: CpaF family protein [Lachnospiraceae bacterium]|nr:CpaF family protein [Lachnospiraceae bacterium]